MKARTIVCLLTVGSLGFGSLAFAQQGNNRRDHDRHDGQRNERRDQRHDERHDQRSDRRDHDRAHSRDRDHRQDSYHYGARGPEWRRGGRLPETYRNRQYVVNNWHAHRLSAPPRGHQWVQVGNDYVLAAVATGVIVQLLLNN